MMADPSDLGSRPLSSLRAADFFTDPKRTGTTALIFSIASWFVLGLPLSILCLLMSGFGIYFSVRNKSGTMALVLNALALLLSLGSALIYLGVLGS